MNTNEEKKGKLRNFTFVESADARLVKLKQDTGKDMTLILEDLILGRRQFSPDIETFISEEIARTRHSREHVIETLLYAAMRERVNSTAHPNPNGPSKSPNIAGVVPPNAPVKPRVRKSRQG